MNERIQQLEKQSYTEVMHEMGGTYMAFDKEKFAELIVQECAHVAVFKDSGTVATADVAGHMAAGRSIAARLIKQHFGVEE
jgi:hypothetical protein